jgi:hypothetical protein
MKRSCSADTFLAGLWNHSSQPVAPQERAFPVQKYHVYYSKERDEQLQALGLIPYFLNKLPSMQGPRVITMDNVDTLRSSARNSTKVLLDEKMSSMNTNGAPTPTDMGNHDAVAISMGDNASAMLTWFGKAQSNSPDRDTNEELPFVITETLPMFIAAEQYYRRIMGLRPPKPGDLMETRVQWRKLGLLQRHLQRSEADMKAGKCSSAFWLHKAFCGLLGNEIFEATTRDYVQDQRHEVMYEMLRSRFAGHVRTWAEFQGITKWQDARENLESVLWPESPHLFANEGLARTMWDEAVGTR